MSEDKYSTRRSRKSADALKGRATGGKLPMFKIKKKLTELFILTPKDPDAPVVFTSYIHKFTQGHGKNFKVLKQCASPTFTQEQDEITDLGWAVRDEYGKDDSKSKADFWRQLVADNSDHILVLDINDVEAGPQIFKMPHKVATVVIPALDECMENNDGDLHEYCHPEEGKILVIEINGEDGFQRKYTNVEFDLDKPANLFGDNIITEEEFDSILNKRPKMDSLQPPFNKEEFESYIDFCFEKGDEIGINLDDIGKGDAPEDVNYSDDGSEDVNLDSQIDDGGETEEPARSARGSRGRGTSEEEAPARGTRGTRGTRGGRASGSTRGGRARR